MQYRDAFRDSIPSDASESGGETAHFRDVIPDSVTPDASEAGGIACEGLTAGRLLRHVAKNERREVDHYHVGA